MSRLTKKPIVLPKGVQVTIDDKSVVVKGPKGELKRDIFDEVKLEQKEDGIYIIQKNDNLIRKSEQKKIAMMCGTFASLLKSMIIGVSEGFKKELEIVGVGYRAQLKGKNLILNLGYSHPIEVVPPEGIVFEVSSPTAISVSGIKKDVVGQVAANIKRWRIPIVYSGKGIRYKGEYIRTKVGKKV